MSVAKIDAWGVDETQHAIVEEFVSGLSSGPMDVRVQRRGRRVLLEVMEHVSTHRKGDMFYTKTSRGLIGKTYPSLDAARAAFDLFIECGISVVR